MKNNQYLLMFHPDYLFFRLIAYPIVNMEVIEAVGQIGYIELHTTAFSCDIANLTPQLVVQPEFKNRFNSIRGAGAGLIKRYSIINGFLFYLPLEYH